MNILIFTIWPVDFWNTPKSEVARLRERFPEITFIHAETDTDAAAAIETADIALASRLTPAMVEHAPRLRWVHSTAASVDILPLKELASRGIAVSNSRGIQAVPIAEHVIGGLLVLSRRFNVMMNAQREHRWIQNELTRDAWPWTLQGRNMTILGLGTIGREVARRAQSFGMRVTGVRRRVDQPVPPFVDRVFGTTRLDEALRGADVLVIAAPFVAGTEGLIRAEHLALLNRGAILINVARAKIVDGAAFLSALHEGQLGGAVLDVFAGEPLDASSPLWSLPNVIISPHSAGVRPEHWAEVIDLFAENIVRFRMCGPLLNLVSVDDGY
jgi:phosphoglycerate dehydrogenase-like enzyme